MNNLFGNLPTVTKNLLIINIVCFIGTMIFDNATRFFGVFYPDSPFFKIWQVITYMFMHGGFGHIFFNMFALVMFGSVIERILGPKRFLNYYIICGLGALILQYGIQAFEVYNIAGTIKASQFLNFNYTTGMVSTNLPITQDQLGTLLSIYGTPMVGASGAIYGLLLAYGFLFPNAELMLIFLPIPIKAKYFIPILIVIELFLGFSNTGGSIAHLAHVGGALFGFILLKMWGIKRTNYY
ncbi:MULTISPECIES: rhomboid family intramembrane serine protease [Sphingobacterium]|uniref:rhomboid family intramembrane serine protease n=1 Tax=Sphingobacterium TaxID=28453 RepID=UPI000B93B1EE|nr:MULTISPECIES: rhomboid family intramembrane serine protease [Sphingobacterium]OYD40649.1 rhomboid family intramembrane serine protease [Sphingobacterium cellulitidis]OYD44133.1 rhomboid family intramembrane serine protease [Sphingobacterium cellulitidis]WFB62990.1 rhomboid family intramembrane serine protease [Sphingobacterium sp. WM]